MLLHRREMASAVDSTPDVPFTFCLRSSVSPFLSSLNIVHTFSIISSSGSEAFKSRFPESCVTLVFTISISDSRFAGAGSITILKRRFNAADISLTPLSLVLAVAITENPFLAGTSSASSGTDMRFSERSEISASCTSEAQREISSTRAIVPSSIALNTGLLSIASNEGPFATSIA